MNDRLLRAELERDEGNRLTMYDDGLGNQTVGIGHNMRQPISPAVRDLLYREDSERAKTEAWTFAWFPALNDVRQRVIVNMLFNMGLPRFLGFTKMIAALSVGDYATAAFEMLASEWAIQVGARAHRLAQMMHSGFAGGSNV